MTRPLRTLLPRALPAAALLVMATLASYASTFSAGFVDVDDADFVTENEMVLGGITRHGVASAFGSAHAGNWFPLTWLSHMADVAAFGLSPGAHHAVNLALHAINALLLFAALRSLTGALAPSFAVAAVFALHPLQVESVAWISQRKTTLSTGLGFLAIWLYARYARSGARRTYLASLATFALSLLAKQTLVTMPFLLLLLDFWPLARLTAADARRRAIEKLPYAVLAVAASAAAIAAQTEAIATGATFPLPVRLGNAVLSYVRYLAAFLWPAKLAVFYPLLPEDVTLVRVAAAGAVLLAISAAALAFGRRERPHLLVGWLWFLGTLVPVIGVVQIGAQAMADRYAYVPICGLAIAAVWSVRERLASPGAGSALRAAAVGGFAAACLLFAVATRRQAEKWHDSIALLEDAVADVDGNYVAHRALAGQYFNRGDYPRALRHAEEGAKVARDLGEILPIQGMALYQTGARTAAIAKLEEATRVAPRNVMAFSNLGWVYLQEGDAARAREVLAAAVAVDPRSARSFALLAASQLRLGRLDEAAESFARVVALAPLDFDARIDHARTLGRLGRFSESSAALRDAIGAADGFPAERRPQLLATLHRYRGDVLAEQGDRAGAVADYERALALARATNDAAAVAALEARLRASAASAKPEVVDERMGPGTGSAP
jgi:protein O-mannosyl-transferase